MSNHLATHGSNIDEIVVSEMCKNALGWEIILWMNPGTQALYLNRESARKLAQDLLKQLEAIHERD